MARCFFWLELSGPDLNYFFVMWSPVSFRLYLCTDLQNKVCWWQFQTAIFWHKLAFIVGKFGTFRFSVLLGIFLTLCHIDRILCMSTGFLLLL